VDEAQAMQDFHRRFSGHGEAHLFVLARDRVYRMDADVEVRGDAVEGKIVI
jgi:hypothetical protein